MCDECPKCGGAIEEIDCASACRECGFLVDEPDLVHNRALPSVRTCKDCYDNFVPADGDGSNLLNAPAASNRPTQSAALKRLATQAVTCSNEMKLPETVAQNIYALVSSPIWTCTAAAGRVPQNVSVAVLVCVCARLARYPLTLRSVCCHVDADTRLSFSFFSLVTSRLPYQLPRVPVRHWAHVSRPGCPSRNPELRMGCAETHHKKERS
jgi:hypothetical protein